MRRFLPVVFSAWIGIGASASVLHATDSARAELRSLYFAAVVADRCDFQLTPAAADMLLQAATALQRKLNLSEEAADALFEETETEFEKRLPDACRKDGEVVKGVLRTLEKIKQP